MIAGGAISQTSAPCSSPDKTQHADEGVRRSWGTFWGKRGFFELERGVNALYIESGDCWVGTPEFSMEARVEAGDLVGSMYGVEPAPSTAALNQA